MGFFHLMVLEPEKLGERIRNAREDKGWSQERLADEAGTSKDTIARYERGKIVDARVVYYIALALELPIDSNDSEAYWKHEHCKFLDELMRIIKDKCDSV